ncbi:MAG: glycosyltransferase [Chitinophagales bacterium]|nr:glycosyltransferase [Chitinophagales bacterium]
MKPKVCIFSVVHPGSIEYLNDFFDSLKCQTASCFDVFLVNDSCAPSVINKIVDSYRSFFNLSIFDFSSTHFANRVVGLEQLAESDYEIILFCDSDDILSCDRLEKSIIAHQKSDIVIGDLIPFTFGIEKSYQQGLWRSRIGAEKIIDASFFENKNIAGFGNTSIKKSILDRVTFQDVNPLAPDWFFFNSLIEKAGKVFFSSVILTYYRQHSNNIAGTAKYTPERLMRIYQTKMLHYELMGSLNKSRVEEMKFIEKILSNNQSIMQYCDRLNSRKTNFFWWEETLIN